MFLTFVLLFLFNNENFTECIILAKVFTCTNRKFYYLNSSIFFLEITGGTFVSVMSWILGRLKQYIYVLYKHLTKSLISTWTITLEPVRTPFHEKKKKKTGGSPLSKAIVTLVVANT